MPVEGRKIQKKEEIPKIIDGFAPEKEHKSGGSLRNSR